MNHIRHIQTQGKRTQRLLVVLIFAIAFVMPGSVSHAAETLIVLSGESAPYVNAAKACESQLNKSGIIYKRVLLASLSDDEIKQLKTSVITIGGRASAKLAHGLSPSVHLFYCMTPSPDRIGLTNRPNTSGVSTAIDFASQLDLIKQAIPALQKIGLLYRSTSPNSVKTLEQMRQSIPSNYVVIAVDLDKAKSASHGIKDLLRKDIDVIWTVPDTSVYNSATIKSLLLESLRRETPVFGFSHALVRAGATFGVGIDPAKQGQRAASLAISPPTDSDHQSATPEIAINLIVAKRIHLQISQTLISAAKNIFR